LVVGKHLNKRTLTEDNFKNLFRKLPIFFILLFALSCANEKEVTITKDYVINPNWDKVSNSITLERMCLKNCSSIDYLNAEPSELINKLETDTNFAYSANVKFNGVEYSQRKVFFNKENGFVWRKRPDLDPSRNLTFSTLGELEKETWYFLGGLSNIRTLYYLYTDSDGKLHKYKVSAVHWTNI